MLVADNVQLTGATIGSCLKIDALRKAMPVQQQQSKLVTYDTTDEEDATIGVQLGCAGIIQVLIEPLLPNAGANTIDFLRKAVAGRQAGVLVTLFSIA
jgi:xanthine/CO dehydrogenase XdhC/CoxF family maturation factor